MSTYTWIGPDNGNWSTASNWSPQPSSHVGATNNDNIIFPNLDIAAITINLDISIAVSSMTFNNSSDDGGTIYTLQSNNGSTLKVDELTYSQRDVIIKCALISSDTDFAINKILPSNIALLSIVLENNYSSNINVVNADLEIMADSPEAPFTLSGAMNLEDCAVAFVGDVTMTGVITSVQGSSIQAKSGTITINNKIEVDIDEIFTVSGNIVWKSEDGSDFKGTFKYESESDAPVGECLIYTSIAPRYVTIVSSVNMQFFSEFLDGVTSFLISASLDSQPAIVDMFGTIENCNITGNGGLSFSSGNKVSLIVQGDFTADATTSIKLSACPETTIVPIVVMGKITMPSSGIPVVASGSCKSVFNQHTSLGYIVL